MTTSFLKHNEDRMPISFDERCAGSVRKHDQVYMNNSEYTIIDVSFGGCSRTHYGKVHIVTQDCNGENFEKILKVTDMIHLKKQSPVAQDSQSRAQINNP